MTTTLEKLTARDSAVDELLFQIRAIRLLAPVREFKFHKTRKWRFDLAFRLYAKPVGNDGLSELVNPMLAIEVDGGGFIPGGGRHSRGQGIENDCEKYAEAMKLGWRVLRVTPKMVRDGRALAYIQELLK